MFAVDPLLALFGLTTLALVILAALLAAALRRKGPLQGRLVVARRPAPDAEEETAESAESITISPSMRFLAREARPDPSRDTIARRHLRPADDELDEVLRGSFAAATFNRAVRVLTWSFILAVMAIVSISQLWQPVEPEIFLTLMLAGVFVLVVHEILPAGRLGTFRMIAEASAAVLFLTMLVVLTGHSQSPFFYLYPLLVGGAAIVAAPRVTVVLTVETVVAYAVAAFSGPMDGGQAARETLARVGINLTALLLLAYAGIVISRVQKRTRNAAIRLSSVDSLTDLYNRAYLFNAVEREIQRSRRFRRGFCLLMMDLDGLKAINDRHGHFQGDLVLRSVAQVIRSSLRRVDTAARYGGDEFVAILPETDPTGAYVVAEKIRQDASDLLVEADGQKVSTSLSIGVVSYPEDGETADELMIAADEAMYSSKRLGKNRVVGYADPLEGMEGPASRSFRPLHTPGFRAFEREGEARESWAEEAASRREPARSEPAARSKLGGPREPAPPRDEDAETGERG